MTDEEQLLLNVITSDSTTIAETLKDLLQCGKKNVREHGAVDGCISSSHFKPNENATMNKELERYRR